MNREEFYTPTPQENRQGRSHLKPSTDEETQYIVDKYTS